MVPRPTNGQRRAAGVSPPWFVNGVCNGNATDFRVSRAHARSAFHGGLTPPALDCCTTVRPWKTAFCDAQTHIRLRAAGVSPPWFVNGVCNCNATNFRVSRSHARSALHGGLTPPALDCCTIVRPWKTAFCDAQTHIRSRAAGVSPPWFAIPTLYRENRVWFRDRRTDNEERRSSARRGVYSVERSA
jgi:hypothetical protein